VRPWGPGTSNGKRGSWWGAYFMAKISYSYDQAANKIATTGWAGAATTPITYAFRASDASSATFVKLNATQMAAVESALDLWSDIANITFTRVAPTGYSNSASILIGGDTNPADYAYGYFPGSRLASSVDGDLTLNPANNWFTNVSYGSYDFTTIIHELGHTIGLDHPGAYNGGTPTYAANAEYLQDSLQYTVMSYFDAENTGASFAGIQPSTPLLHDIAAAQLLYGANMHTRTGNTVYGFHSNADRAAFHIDAATQKSVFAIWDAGGSDTLDLSGYSPASKINLNQMTFSSAGGLKDNISIARGVWIENAIGGAGNDTITGNAIANCLKGGAGNDTITGGNGIDTLFGGAGYDSFVFNAALNPANADKLEDFAPAYDTIKLENAIYKGLGTATGVLSAASFFTGAAAHDASDRIIYNKLTGDIFYDADGTGASAAVKIAVIDMATKPALTSADFVII